jgi:hypothetical protein
MRKFLLVTIIIIIAAACNGSASNFIEQSMDENESTQETIPIPTLSPTNFSDGEFLNIPEGDTFRVMNYNIVCLQVNGTKTPKC